MRPLYEIAREISNNWKPVNYAAKPYLDAMSTLNDIDQSYGQNSGRGIVMYFLSNASSWRGEIARRVKTELKSLLKE
jgi:hypothetical protein